MCEFLSFAVDKKGQIYASNLSGHYGIEEAWNLKPGEYREAEWTNDTEKSLTVRVEEGEEENFYRALILGTWPARIELIQHILGKNRWRGGWLNLRGCTFPEGFKMPESVGEWLDLSGCTLPEGFKMPESVGGSLNLRGCTLPEGFKMPKCKNIVR